MSDPAIVLGLDFGGTKIAAAVCDLRGNKLAATVVESLALRGARASLDQGIRAGRDVLAAAPPNTRLAAVGVSTFGIPHQDRVELAPAIDGWGALELGRELSEAFPAVDIRVANDVKAAAFAEARWGSLADSDPGVYLNLGTGLATAIVIGGRVLAGSHGAAGEIGYSLRSPADVGLPVSGRTPLEDMVSGQALQRRASATAEGLTTAEVFAADGHDAGLAALVNQFVEELAFHVVNLAILIDPARIAVGGGMVRSWERIGPRLTEALRQGVPYPPDLVVASFPHEAPLLGAVALAIDAAFDGLRGRAATATDPAATPGEPTGTAGVRLGTVNQQDRTGSNGHSTTEGIMSTLSQPGSLPAGDSQGTSHPASGKAH